MNTDKAPVITVKNLKYAEFASQETPCFEATVYVDGKRFCASSNEGHGGPNMDYPIGGTMAMSTLLKQIEELNKRIAATAKPPLESEPEWEKELWERGFRPDFEMMVMEAVNTALAVKTLKKELKKAVFMEEDGKLYRARHLNAESAAKAYPKANILNLLPFEEALDIYMRAT